MNKWHQIFQASKGFSGSFNKQGSRWMVQQIIKYMLWLGKSNTTSYRVRETIQPMYGYIQQSGMVQSNNVVFR